MQKTSNQIWFALRNFSNDQSGQDLVKYALLCGLVVSLAVAVFSDIGSVSGLYTQAMNALSAALSATAYY
jgi:Flp pilus assembly pilin Flp